MSPDLSHDSITEPVPGAASNAASAAGAEDAELAAALRRAIVADITSVAGTVVDAPRGLSFDKYAEAGGRFTMGAFRQLATWKQLCEAAGVRCGSRGGQPAAPGGSGKRPNAPSATAP